MYSDAIVPGLCSTSVQPFDLSRCFDYFLVPSFFFVDKLSFCGSWVPSSCSIVGMCLFSPTRDYPGVLLALL